MSCSYIYSVCGSGAILNVPDMSTGLVIVLWVQGANTRDATKSPSTQQKKMTQQQQCQHDSGLGARPSIFATLRYDPGRPRIEAAATKYSTAQDRSDDNN